MILSKNKSGFYRDGVKITESEYNRIKAIIDNRPTAHEGYGYRLTESLEWELYELPPAEESAEELSADTALEIILGGTA